MAHRLGRRLPCLSRERPAGRARGSLDGRRYLSTLERGTTARRLRRRSGTHGGQWRRVRAERRTCGLAPWRDAGPLQRRRPQAYWAAGPEPRAARIRTAVALLRPAARACALARQQGRCHRSGGPPRAAARAPRMARHREPAPRRAHRGAQGAVMTPEQIVHVFGRGRLKMVTGEHVEVFREAVAPGERRRYTKRFLNTREGDFGQWTEREWRILARLIGHGIACVPDVVQFDRGHLGGMQLVQTYDAGVTVDQWATLLPVIRDGRVQGHVFEDCAHWWALAHHCLLALNVIHPLELVHLDIKGDHVCIPYAPASFDPDSSDLKLRPVFAQLALIDFAFALVSRESLTTPLPLGWQKEYDYQSPRLLAALEAGRNGELQLTRELDWRCDMYSLAAMLKRHLPEESLVLQSARAAGWTTERYDAAQAFILGIRDCHDGEFPAQRPHAALIEQSGTRLGELELALSLERGWTLAREASVSAASASPLTPVTRLAPPVRVVRSGRITAVTVIDGAQSFSTEAKSGLPATPHAARSRPARRARGPIAAVALIATCAAAAAMWYLGDRLRPTQSEIQALAEPIRAAAYQASDALHRLVRRGEEAQERDVVAGQASAPSTAAEDSPA